MKQKLSPPVWGKNTAVIMTWGFSDYLVGVICGFVGEPGLGLKWLQTGKKSFTECSFTLGSLCYPIIPLSLYGTNSFEEQTLMKWLLRLIIGWGMNGSWKSKKPPLLPSVFRRPLLSLSPTHWRPPSHFLLRALDECGGLIAFFRERISMSCPECSGLMHKEQAVRAQSGGQGIADTSSISQSVTV